MKRKALFIGVNDYADNQIRNLSCSVRDAHSMNDIFEEIGYETKCLEDPNKGDVFHAVGEMTAGLSTSPATALQIPGNISSSAPMIGMSCCAFIVLEYHSISLSWKQGWEGTTDRSCLMPANQISSRGREVMIRPRAI